MTSTSDFKREESISVQDTVLTIREWIRYFISKWYIIVAFGLLGVLLGFGYSVWKKPLFTAITSFVLDAGTGSGGMGAYTGLASSLGIDVGGGGGLFAEENIMELYRSRRMLSKTLLTPVQPGGASKELLIDRFIEFKEYREEWKDRPELKNIQFKADNDYGNNMMQQRIHDSLLGRMVIDLNEDFLEVEKKEGSPNIIMVTIKSPDELFSKNFNNALVTHVNRFYLDTKTKGAQENVAILEKKVDSVRSRLGGNISRTAAVADATPNQNPTRMAQRVVPMQSGRVDAEINEGVLATLLQNLEVSKMSLMKERPLIQIVDEPILPLGKAGLGRIKGMIIGAFIGLFLVMVFLAGKKSVSDALKTE